MAWMKWAFGALDTRMGAYGPAGAGSADVGGREMVTIAESASKGGGTLGF